MSGPALWAVVAWMAAFVACTVMSWATGRHVPPRARLAMQFGVDGQPTWRAPRDVMLGCTPLLCLALAVAYGWGFSQTGPSVHMPRGVFLWGVILLFPTLATLAHIWSVRKAVMNWRQEGRPS